MVNFLLDADETILDFVRSSEESLAHTMRAFGLPYGKEMYAAYKRINDGLWREYERGEIDKKSLMRERFSRFFASLGIEADPDAANAMYFETLCRTGYLLAGADAFLHALKERGRIFLVTNGTPAAQYGRLASLGLESFFDGVYISDEIGYKKPDARFFGVLLQREGIEREDCLVIGDSLSSDIAGANNAKIACVWYAPAGAAAEGARPDFTAKTYEDILRIADAWAKEEMYKRSGKGE